MASQLIPPPDVAPPGVKHMPLEKRIELWAGLVDDCEALLWAGLRSRHSCEAEAQQAYRQWQARQGELRERRQIQFLKNLSMRESADGD